MSPIDSDAPPAGEEIHLPSPSILPLINAAGVAIALIGLTLSWYFVAFGALVFVLTSWRWIRDTRSDIESLPAEHR